MKSPNVVLLACCSLVASPALAIVNGGPDGDAHPQVGEVYDLATSCTGTLIAPDVFLTAGHCTEALRFYQETYGLDVYVSLAEDVAWPEPDRLAVHVETHPRYAMGPNTSEFVEFDVGLVFLKDAVAGVTPGTLPGAGAVADLEDRALLEIVGYGARGFATGGGPPSPGGYDSRYGAVVELRLANERNAVLEDQMIRTSQSPGHGLGGGCYGDSGGPVFRPGTLELLAVYSWGQRRCTGVAHAQRLDHPEILEWIRSYLRE